MKSKLCIRKRWNQQIEVLVELDRGGIALSTPLDSFLAALVEQVGNPSLIVTKKGLLEKLSSAADVVRLELQQASTEIIQE